MSETLLLIAEGDAAVRSQILAHTVAEGYEADEAANGLCALKLFRRKQYSVVLLDMELPELDGRIVCRQIRKVSDVPVLMLSSLTGEQDRLTAFRLGADDYILKPFFYSELVARVKVALRRGGLTGDELPRRITHEGICVDTPSRTVYVDERVAQLTPREYELLCFLMQNPNTAFSRESLLNQVWGYDFLGSDRTVDTHIKTLRENVRPYHRCIATVWGYGYKFET